MSSMTVVVARESLTSTGDAAGAASAVAAKIAMASLVNCMLIGGGGGGDGVDCYWFSCVVKWCCELVIS